MTVIGGLTTRADDLNIRLRVKGADLSMYRA